MEAASQNEILCFTNAVVQTCPVLYVQQSKEELKKICNRLKKTGSFGRRVNEDKKYIYTVITRN